MNGLLFFMLMMWAEEGYFYRTTTEAQANVYLVFVAPEVEAQIERAIKAGLDLTHIDTHMGTMFPPNFLSAYLAGARG